MQWRRGTQSRDGRGHPCLARDECAIHYDRPHTCSGCGASAVPRTRSCGRDIPVGLCRSVSRRTDSATASPAQWACRGYPAGCWRENAVSSSADATRPRQRHAFAPAEIADALLPAKLAVGDGDQERVHAIVIEPMRHFLVDPCGRVGFTNNDRLFFIQLYRWFPSVLKAVTIIRPQTLVRWLRVGFRRLCLLITSSIGEILVISDPKAPGIIKFLG